MTPRQLALGLDPRPAPGFDELCRRVAAQGRGLTLKQIGSLDSLSRELEKAEPDRERIDWLCERLGLDPEEVGDGRA